LSLLTYLLFVKVTTVLRDNEPSANRDTATTRAVAPSANEPGETNPLYGAESSTLSRRQPEPSSIMNDTSCGDADVSAEISQSSLKSSSPTDTCGALLSSAYFVPARSTAAANGGIDTVVSPFESARVARTSPHTAANSAFGDDVGTVNVTASSELLNNVRYSVRSAESNRLIADFVRDKIRSIVRDPETARKLTPESVIGCKRLCVDTDYYDTFNRANVSLVDLREQPIERFTERGIVLGSPASDSTDGAARSSTVEHEFDAIVFATGFDAMTGAIEKIDIIGRDGRRLRDAWSAGPVNYLGLGVHGFPNLFTVTGPGSPSVLTNMIVSIEHHVEWITECLAWMKSNGKATIEADSAAQDSWVQHVNAVAGMTLYTSCSSWYLGANVPGKPRVFMPLPGFPAYAQKCAEVAQNGYRGFLT